VAAAQLDEVLTGLVVDVDAMRRHVDEVGPALVSERVLTTIAALPNGAAAVAALRPVLRGRARARHLTPLLRAYLHEAVLTDAEIEDLLDPLQYLGATEPLIDRALARHDARPRTRPNDPRKPDPAQGET
jgi:3-carboxy-cis,cis-muconate cycloisomerase